MTTRRNTAAPQSSNGNMIFGSGDTSYVSAEMLKKVDTGVETLLGIANGVLSGAIISIVASTALTAAHMEGGQRLLKEAAKNWTGKHGLGVLLGTTALGTLGGIVRHSRAVKHNEWSERHYAHMEQQHPVAGDFTARLNDERNADVTQGRQ